MFGRGLTGRIKEGETMVIAGVACTIFGFA